MNCEPIASVQNHQRQHAKVLASESMVKFIRLSLLLVFLPLFTNAQLLNLEFESYNTSKGMSQNLVYAIVQDKNGYLWFGTDDGLNRFDGYEFKVFKHIPG